MAFRPPNPALERQNLPVVGPDGSVDWVLAVFVITFKILVGWVLLQISVAVLLDNFMSTSSRMETEERVAWSESPALRAAHSPLRPLVERLATDYANADDLAQQLHLLFQAGIRGGSC